jgi:hypothetical protein
MACSGARAGYAATLLLEFGEHNQPDARGYQCPEMGLIAECAWRLETPERVLAADLDADDTIERGLSVPVGQQLTAFDVFPPSFMLKLQFEDDLVVWTFPERSSDYAEVDDDPSVSWYITGIGVPEGWEEGA